MAQTLRPERGIPTKNIFHVPIETLLYENQFDYREEKQTELGDEFTDAVFVKTLEIRCVVVLVSPICNQLGVLFQVNLCKIS